MSRRGLLLTITEPPPAMEEEFNAWYDDEHLAERLSIPGFLSARRWVAQGAPGQGKYLATYELESLAVLQSEKYLFHFKNQSPWSRRCLSRCVVFRRWACEQAKPGSADSDPAARAIVFASGTSPLDRLDIKGSLTARYFHAPGGEPPHVALFELANPAGAAIPAGASLYRAYG